MIAHDTDTDATNHRHGADTGRFIQRQRVNREVDERVRLAGGQENVK